AEAGENSGDDNNNKEDGEGGSEGAFAAILAESRSGAAVNEGGIAPVTAIVSYYADGYEKRFTPENIQSLRRSVMETLPAESTDLTREWVRAGEPVYKITDNNLWYLVFWVQADEAGEAAYSEPVTNDAGEETAPAALIAVGDYKIGADVTLDLETTRVTAAVKSITRQGGEWYIVLSSDMYYKDLVKYRKKDVTIVFAEYSGAVVSEKAISSRDGQAGVYVRQQSGTFKWVPVNILLTTGGKHLISETIYYDAKGQAVRTISYYDEIMSDPASEGY
ncbi:MAG: hypothetical protein LBS85_00845, partial [Clostridiales Family XIII bacterium]|nr:hypothetical protein [Clostridiales Family XIII bacterium]